MGGLTRLPILDGDFGIRILSCHQGQSGLDAAQDSNGSSL